MGEVGEGDEDEDEAEVGNWSEVVRSHIVFPKDTPVAGVVAVAEMSTTLISYLALLCELPCSPAPIPCSAERMGPGSITLALLVAIQLRDVVC